MDYFPIIERIRAANLFDDNFYFQQRVSAGIHDFDSPLTQIEHYLTEGYKHLLDPCAELSTRSYLDMYPDVAAARSNPLIHHIMQDIREVGASDIALAIQDNGDASELEVMRPEFSVAYYLARNTDVADAGLDPLRHYYYTGWREGRNPNREFDTQYYLRANEDVRIADIHPFWHYLVAGRAEGRKARPGGGFRRQIIDGAREPERRTADYVRSSEIPLSTAVLTRLLVSGFKDKTGFVVSVSHDCYTAVVGGTQILISDEQKLFNSDGYGYLHLSPKDPRLTLAGEDRLFMVRLILDGELLGVAPLDAVRDILGKELASPGRSIVFVVHCILGFYPPDLCELWSMLKPGYSYYWLHDYSSVCEGMQLLRNDVEFCGAPPATSLACRVCVYGSARASYLASLQKLFEHCAFEVISPSQATLDLWRRISDLPHQSVHVHPHWTLKPKPAKRLGKGIPVRTDKVSIAFVGRTSPAKGWPIYAELAAALDGDSRYELYHFVDKGEASLPGLQLIETAVTPSDRDATSRLLREHGIDIVALLSPWPETFSFVAHEALLAGAQLVCLEDSGNVAALVSKTERGVVLPTPEAVIDFFTSGAAVARLARSRAAQRYDVIQSGATASLVHAGS